MDSMQWSGLIYMNDQLPSTLVITMFKIEEKLVAGLLNYLASKPYAEVAGLIDALQKLPKEDKQLKEKNA